MPPTKTLPALLLAPNPEPCDSALPLAAFGVDESTHDDLRWFFEDALSAIELQSNCAKSFQRRVHRVGDRNNREYDDEAEARIRALHKARGIYERLMKLPPADLRVIKGLYTPRVVPPWLEETCGWLAPLVYGMSADAGDLSPEREGELLPLLDEATGAAARALRAYEVTRFPAARRKPVHKEGL